MLQLSDDHPINAANYSLQSVLAKTKHSNEAWAMIDYLAHSGANKEYLKMTGKPTALRINIADQKKIPELAPFASQLLTAENWYRGKDFSATNKAIQDMFHEWVQPVSDEKVLQYHKDVLDRAAGKINQTF